jgi:hypothetical protein
VILLPEGARNEISVEHQNVGWTVLKHRIINPERGKNTGMLARQERTVVAFPTTMFPLALSRSSA